MWTERKVEMLCAHVRNRRSFSQIASYLGVTRSAAIGKYNRLVSAGQVPKAHQPTRHAMAKRTCNCDVAASRVLALEEHHCRWPIGDPASPNFRFCGARKERGSYCEYHRGIAYQEE